MDKLAEIMEWKRKEVSPRIRPVNLNELEKLSLRFNQDLSFINALAQEELSVIAEIKRRSPSAGDIAESASAVEQARLYLNVFWGRARRLMGSK
jgi:indole-3-glycerol phosphate synthase